MEKRSVRAFDQYSYYDRRKGRDLTQPYDRSPYTDRKIQKET